MELSPRMKSIIETKLADCERVYNVKVLFWSFRGSIDAGIFRKNSDLDLVFVFKNMSADKVVAIHDIVGYGFDFWGWNIEDVIKTIEINNYSFYEKRDDFHNISLSHEHARGGLTYHYGIYCWLNNSRSGSNLINVDELRNKLACIIEKRVLISHILAGVEAGLTKLETENGMSACDYLYMTWRVLLAEHVFNGGMPGESDIDMLMNLYMDKKTAMVVNRLKYIYRDSLSKHAQFFIIEELNKFISDKYNYLRKIIKDLKPENEKILGSKIKEIKDFVGEL